MIALLTGTLAQKIPGEIIVEVNGVGYRVFVSLLSLTKLPETGQPVTLLIHTAVREDDISLYGFLNDQEKQIFQKLISVSGIGPRLAMTILSGILPADLAEALRSEDLVRLTSISGIGKKTAERMILELKDKLVAFAETAPKTGKRKLHEDILSVLLNLGYNRPQAERTLSRLNVSEGASLEHHVKEALKILAEQRA